MSTALILYEYGQEVATVSPEVVQRRDAALAHAGLVWAITDPASNSKAMAALKALKDVRAEVEKERKRINQPMLDAQRLINATAEAFLTDTIEEIDRLGALDKAYQTKLSEEEYERKRAETLRLRKIQEDKGKADREAAEKTAAAAREAARVARAEADRIEQERRAAAELARVQAEKERLAAKSEADKIAAEQRAIQARARVEEDARIAQEQADKAAIDAQQALIAQAQQAAIINAQTATAQAEVVKTDEIRVRAKGQSVKQDIEFEVFDGYNAFLKNPHLFELKPKSLDIKEHIKAARVGNEHYEMPGIRYKVVSSSSLRGPKAIAVQSTLLD